MTKEYLALSCLTLTHYRQGELEMLSEDKISYILDYS